jgi:hypothetical protein
MVNGPLTPRLWQRAILCQTVIVVCGGVAGGQIGLALADKGEWHWMLAGAALVGIGAAVAYRNLPDFTRLRLAVSAVLCFIGSLAIPWTSDANVWWRWLIIGVALASTLMTIWNHAQIWDKNQSARLPDRHHPSDQRTRT